jgi:hypothetical protein
VKFFLTFFRPRASLFSEGKFSPNLPPAGLVGPIQPGDPPGIVDGRGDERADHESEPTTRSDGSK